MEKFDIYEVKMLEDVGVDYKGDEDIFTGFAFYDADSEIVSFGIDKWSGANALFLGVPDHVFLDFNCKVDKNTAAVAIRDFVTRTVAAETYYQKQMARLRLGLMLKGYIKPLASNTEKEASAI